MNKSSGRLELNPVCKYSYTYISKDKTLEQTVNEYLGKPKCKLFKCSNAGPFLKILVY